MRQIHRVFIAGVPLDIDYIDDPHLGDTDVDGFYCGTSNKIVIDSEQSKTKQQQTLFHELLHAALDKTGASELISDEVEHAIIVALENHVWPLLQFRTNSKLIFKEDGA